MNWKVLFVGLGLTLTSPIWAQKGSKSGELRTDVEVTLMLDKEKVEPNQKVGITMGVALPDGKKALLEMQRDRFMHVYVIAADMSYFEHLTPDLDKDGNFKMDLSLPRAGTYQLFCDFKAAGVGPRIVPVDIKVEGKGGGNPVPSSEIAIDTRTVDDYEVKMQPRSGIHAGKEAEITFSVKKNGKPVKDLDPYLANLGYAVVARTGVDSAIVPLANEMAADGPDVAFKLTPTRTGTHKIWFEFKHDKKVRVVDFAFSVEKAPKPAKQEVIRSVPAE